MGVVPLVRGAIDMKRRVCMKRLRRLKCKCHETRHFVRNEMSRIVIFLSWKKVTNRDFFFVVRNGPNYTGTIVRGTVQAF